MPGIKAPTNSIVFSTDPDYRPESSNVESSTSFPPEKQELRLHLDRRGGGKVVTIVRGFQGPVEDLEFLARALKKQLGTGGSVKNGEILIQGSVRDQVLKYLRQNNYQVKKAGG